MLLQLAKGDRMQVSRDIPDGSQHLTGPVKQEYPWD
jgi:hypothetical protein